MRIIIFVVLYINLHMTTAFRARPLVLFVGDVCAFVFALWASLFFRTFSAPSWELFTSHLSAFSFLFVVWVGVFIVAGLYESRSIIFARRALSVTLLAGQTVNVTIAALFFFFIPLFGIAPKTILFIYLVTSFLFVLVWRVFLFPWLGIQKVENAIVVGEGKEIDELVVALYNAPRAPTRVVATIKPSDPSVAALVTRAIDGQGVRFVIADLDDRRVAEVFPELYNFISRGVRFVDALTLYEEIYGRAPLSQIDEQWLARNVSRYMHTLYDPVKRGMDIVGGLVGGVISLLFYPFIILAIKLDDGGPAFIVQDRVGQDNESVRIHKFRTMSGNDNGKYGPGGSTSLTVTRVGRFLRASRLDELPQFWDVVMGKLSLVGPRLELPSLVKQYEKQIPYYGVRNLIKPGLFGWAQLYYHGDPHHAADVEATKMKLSYDLYYLKHRSLVLDTLITFKTIRRLLIKSNA